MMTMMKVIWPHISSIFEIKEWAKSIDNECLGAYVISFGKKQAKPRHFRLNDRAVAMAACF